MYAPTRWHWTHILNPSHMKDSILELTLWDGLQSYRHSRRNYSDKEYPRQLKLVNAPCYKNLQRCSDTHDKVVLQYCLRQHQPTLRNATDEHTETTGSPICSKNQLYASRTRLYVSNAAVSSSSKEYISFMRNSRALNSPARGRNSSRNFRPVVNVILKEYTYLIDPYWKFSVTM
jgi:hypothetical protein